MKIRVVLGCLLVAGAVGFAAGRAFTDEEGGGAAPPMDPGAMEEAFKALATPGPEHERLAFLCGDWTVEGDLYFGPMPTKAQGEAHFEWLLGDRYMAQNFQADMAGQPYEGMGVLGFSNAQKKYQQGWIDNWGTSISSFVGEWDAASGELVLKGMVDTPMGATEVTDHVKRASDDAFTYTSFANMGGSMMKVMELRYARKKE
jgi:hypothetical protein